MRRASALARLIFRRAVSLDSRDADIGCVAEEQIAGKLVFRIWPFTRIGTVG